MSEMYIQLHDNITDHPKTLKCARDLRISIPQIVGHLACLWTWTLRMASDGNYSSFDSDDIELGAKWEGERGLLVSTLIKHRFLDEKDGVLFVHDWDIYAESIKKRDQKRKERERKKQDVARLSPDCRPTVADCRAEQNRTEQNREEQIGTEQKGSSESSDVRQVLEYWAEKTWSGKGRKPAFDAKRRRCVAARLKDGYSVDELCRVVDGYAASPWHNGTDPKSNGKTYLDATLMFRDVSHVEKMLVETPKTKPLDEPIFL